MRAIKILIVLIFFGALLVAWRQGLLQELTFVHLKQQQVNLSLAIGAEPLKSALIFFIVYIVAAIFCMPGISLLTLLGGALFGLWPAVILVSFASSLGSAAAFLLSRFMFRDLVRAHLGQRLVLLEQKFIADGPLYLLGLRLIPAVPYFFINLAMGLTSIDLASFYFVSQLGMLPGTFIYANAGTRLASIQSPSQIFSPILLGSLCLLAILPFLIKKLLKRFIDV